MKTIKTDADKHNSFRCKGCGEAAVSFHYGVCDKCCKVAVEALLKTRLGEEGK